MIAVLIAMGTALLITLFGTPLFIRFLVRQEYGQFIRQDGPTTHETKRGTPTMGGVIIIVATLVGYAVANVAAGRTPGVSGILLLYLMCGVGFIGFLDDFKKIKNKRSLGLKPLGKIVGQAFVGISFAVMALRLRNDEGLTPASTRISIVRNTGIDLAYFGLAIGVVLFIIWVNFLITAWSNAVNLTDGLDGLATGSSMIAFSSYVVIAVWQSYQSCRLDIISRNVCYDVRDPRDLAIICAAVVGACFGFLWWNTSPARIFMGDTGSLALGGAFAGVSIFTQTEILAVFIGGLWVIIVFSDVIQIGCFKLTHKRVFRMAPLHHHFELAGWKEITIVVRFWIIEALLAAVGLALFYGEWLARL